MKIKVKGKIAGKDVDVAISVDHDGKEIAEAITTCYLHLLDILPGALPEVERKLPAALAAWEKHKPKMLKLLGVEC